MAKTNLPATSGQRGPVTPDYEAEFAEETDENYTVGFCRPPIEHQFKPGTSGNPRGRPRKKRELYEILEDCLLRNTKIRTADGIRTVSAVEAIFSASMRKACEGDPRVLRLLFEQVEKIYSAKKVREDEIKAEHMRIRNNGPLSLF